MDLQKRKRLEEAVKAQISLTDIVEAVVEVIADDCDPDDVFEKETLETWATENGYVQKEDE